MEIKVPEVGESVFEALVAKWLKKDGEQVRRDEPVCEIETDKITMELNAEADGILSVRVREGETVKVGTVIGVIAVQAVAAAPPVAGVKAAVSPAGPAPAVPPLSPAVRKLAEERGIRPETIPGSGRGGRVTVDDLLNSQSGAGAGRTATSPGPLFVPPAARSASEQPKTVVRPQPTAARPEPTPVRQQPQPAVRGAQVSSSSPAPVMEERLKRVPMSPIRKRIAERLVAVRQQTAMLTTFNEADMGRVIAMRRKHQEHFLRKYGVKLGFMSFFVKACVEALKEFPLVNARIDGDDIVYQNFYDIGIAIGADKGLVVPVIRNADHLHFAHIEQAIADFVEKIRTNRLAIADLEGGTFTITNGGVYGSLLSTPILNPPQCGVLGMHAVQDRPVVREGKIVVRPMMNLALSYDHRLIDGREAVNFLKRVKEYVEEPEEMLLEG